jgi:hypothetical protein
MAALNIDEEKITEKINGILEQSGKKRVKPIRKEKLIRFTLKERKCYLKDWILHDKFIYTLRNLHDTKEPLPQLIDVGTVSSPYFRATYN